MLSLHAPLVSTQARTRCILIGLDDNGAIVLREKVSRGRITARLANVPQCLIGIEAGMATHYVARELIALGHDVKQVPPAMPGRSVKVTRTTSGMRTRSRKPCNALRRAVYRLRLTTNWTCRRCTACVLA
jgi:transposase